MCSINSSIYLVNVKGLSKQFDGKNPVFALDNVNLEVKRGEFLAIVGPSGCGKTTLLRIIAGLEQKTSGEILFQDGSDHIGFVFQDPNLLPWRTALTNTTFILELHGVSKEERIEKAQQALALVGLSGYENFYPKDLSGGMRHRVAIARSLVHDPDVLVMDEPFASLDEITRTELNLALRKIWQRTGKTIIYVTHDLSEAVFLAERVAVMTPQPGSIKEIIDVNLPEDREITLKDTEDFVHIQARVRAALSEDRKVKGRVEPTDQPIPAGKATIAFSLERIKLWVQYLAVFAVFIAVWKGIVEIFRIPTFILPAPDVVFLAYVELWKRGTLWDHTWLTLSEAVLGFLAGAFLGFVLGYMLGKSRRIEQVLSPYIVAAQTAPKIAFAPLVVLWFGFGLFSKVFLAMFIVFFPILVNTLLGLKSIDRDKKELLKAARASRLQTFIKLEVPGMLPELFAGFKTGITFAVIGAVVGEFVGARGGLGYLTIFASGELNMPQAFAAITQLILLGIALYGIVVFLERVVMPWWHSKR
jgi:NitT/TauT family transport system ATP-binding protein